MNKIEAIETIKDELKNFTDIAVIGLSGGADSTLVATLCVEALGPENVYGYGMPYNNLDKNTFNTRSSKLANKLGINYTELPITRAVNAAAEDSDYEGYEGISALNLGNIKSRMRMIYLYTLNQRIAEKTGKRCRVIGTGNLSEDFIGYDTKGGDALADIFPIGQLFKSEVYKLLDYFVEKEILNEYLIDRVPSAGLEDGQTDEQDLGYSYNEMQPAIDLLLHNKILYKYPESFEGIKRAGKPGVTKKERIPYTDREWEIIQFVWDRHIKNRHKHDAPKVIPLRK